jgi:hypothetical protein
VEALPLVQERGLKHHTSFRIIPAVSIVWPCISDKSEGLELPAGCSCSNASWIGALNDKKNRYSGNTYLSYCEAGY